MNRRLCRTCRAALGLLLCCLALLPEAWAQLAPLNVLSYDTRVEIETNGDIIVTEDITIDVATDGTNKGIIRDIPINPRWHELGRQDVRLTVEAVSIDGRACPTDDTELTYPVLSIYMRDKARYLSAGQHVFHLRFRMSEQIGFFEEGDELTWNAVGEYWDGGVRAARAVVFPPAGTNFMDEAAWLGKRGSKKSPVSIRRETIEGREAVVFEAQRPIRYSEAFTVAVQWPGGIVAAPQTCTPEDQWMYTLIYALMLPLSIAAAWALWARYGRDPQVGAVIPQFYPPKVPAHLARRKQKPGKSARKRLVHSEEYMTPVAVHYVHEGGELEAHGMAALFLSLAQRGDCKLLGSARRLVTVEKIASTSPAPEEYTACNKLPESFVLNARKSTHSPIGKVYDACKMHLDCDYPTDVRWNLWPQLLLLVVLMAALGFTATQQLGGHVSELVQESLVNGLVAPLVLLGTVVAAFFFIRALVTRRLAVTLATPKVFILLFVLFLTVYPYVRNLDIFWIFSPLQLGLMLACLLPPAVFCFLMDLPTREQVELKQHIEGLALYISTAETERFNLLNPPEEDLQLYHRLLPYAVALGLEDAWGRRFARQLAEALEEAFPTELTENLVISANVSLSTWREASFAEKAAQYASSSGGGSSFGGFGGGGAGFGGGGGGGRAC